MSSDRFERIKEILLRVADLPEREREAVLDQDCANDPVLRADIEELLTHDAAASRDPSSVEELPVLYNPLPEPLQMDPDSMLPVGATISHYRILGLLGTGGMGEVYKAEDLLLLRPVALKFLRRDAVGISLMEERFGREARAAASVDHPNICPVYSFEQTHGRVFLTMPCIDGRTVKEVIATRRLGVDEAIGIALQAAAGLEAAHAAGIVHRDVKPSNIMVAQDGRVQILDFGLARSSTLPDITKTGVVIGTAAYLSPEQARGEWVDHRTDIWSLGVVLYEMLTGNAPFRRDHELATIYAILNETPTPIRQIRPDSPEGLEPVIEKAMAKDRIDRYARTRDLIDDLVAVRSGATPSIATAERATSMLRSAPQPPPSFRRHNLPSYPTSFIGREQEMDAIEALLGATRLVTLTGVGGTGKTRLSVEVGRRVLADFPDGVWFVELAPLSDPELLIQAIATVLDVRQEHARPFALTLRQALQSRRLLLILDNCEHLAPACARFADQLLRTCPGVKILATSRVPLDVGEEAPHPVPPLALPPPESPVSTGPPDRLLEYEAVRLFCERAHGASAFFALGERNAGQVARICQRLDGIPLAIELAAARTKMLTVEQIAGHLDDRFRLLADDSQAGVPRHRTLHATIEWSYRLLSAEERTLLRRVAVFSGGWTVEAAEAVCAGGSIEAADVLYLLTNLVSKSLMVVEEEGSRYRLLETIRQYGLDRLAETEEEPSLRRRHLDYFLRLAEQAEPHFYGSQQLDWMNRLAAEQDNVRAAIEWSRKEDVGSGLRTAAALVEFWFNRDLFGEGTTQLLGILSDPGAAQPTLERAKALNAAGTLLAWALGDYGTAEPLVEEALAIGKQLGDLLVVARAHLALGVNALGRDNPDLALGHLNECRLLLQALGRPEFLGDAYHHLGNAALRVGDTARARREFDTAYTYYVEAGHRGKVAGMLRHRANIALRLGEIDQATRLACESLTMNAELQSRTGVLSCIVTLAGAGIARGDAPSAARLLGAVDALTETLRTHLYYADQVEYDAHVSAARELLGPGGLEAHRAEGQKMSMDEAIRSALCSSRDPETAAMGKGPGQERTASA